jgi:hypothetical protein
MSNVIHTPKPLSTLCSCEQPQAAGQGASATGCTRCGKPLPLVFGGRR